MLNGLWIVEFIAAPGLSGSGVIILNDGRLLGGDNGYYYSGKYEINGNFFSGETSVIRFDANIISIFGDIDRYSLSFKGQIKDTNHFEALANVVGNPDIKMLAKGTKKEDI